MQTAQRPRSVPVRPSSPATGGHFSPAVVRDLKLFWVSCFMLFFEILMIRWLSAEIRLFSYFHNVVLLFAFLGIGLGVALARRSPYFIPAFAITAALAAILRFEDVFHIGSVSLYLNATREFIIWEYLAIDSLFDQIKLFAAGICAFIALMALVTLFFVPFGQTMGRLFNDYQQPLRAYGVNLAGSLLGIWLFQAVSLLSWPPGVWVAIGGLGTLVLIGWKGWRPFACTLLLVLTVALLNDPGSADGWTVWSPYQKLTVVPQFASIDSQPVQYGHAVRVNSVGYMQITNYSPEFVATYPSAFPPSQVPYDHYNIPYRFAGALDNVLIVGAGAGNDAAGALRNGASRVTAVDIDPRIIDIGRALHPESPYSDPRVMVVNDDARSYFKRTTQTYDLIVFGLLDSHTLSSSYSNVRLDNYVYTRESFQEARRLLRPGGVMVVIFEVELADDFIGERIQGMLAQAFGQQPIGFTVHSGFRGWGGIGFVTGDEAVIARRLATDARLKEIVESTSALHQQWGASAVGAATDDWPYLYLRDRGIPSLYFFMFGTLLLFSFVGVRLAYGRVQRIQWPFFFLGAAFLLLEVQNISKLVLLFGATWTVNAVVISAILVMISLANAYVMRVRITSLWPYYGALLVSLVINFALPLDVFAIVPSGWKEFLVGLVTCLPFFFAGIVFSRWFAATKDPTGALASNLLGAMAGGILEALSFIYGIGALLIVALALYALALLSYRLVARRLGTAS